MLELRRELLRSHFLFDVWPQSNFYGVGEQQPVHDVIVARFPHQLHEKYGDPSSTNIIEKIKNRIKDRNNNDDNQEIQQHRHRNKLTTDEQWNKEFWSNSDDLYNTDNTDNLDDTFLNYPMPGDNHNNDADSPLSPLYKYNKSKIRKKIIKLNLSQELLCRGYVFIFSSGCIVTWGYNGRDRDWIDSFVQLFQNNDRGWPSFDGFNLPFWITLPLYIRGYAFMYPNDMKIVRTDFLNLNWIINKKLDVNIKNKKLSNDIEKWNVNDVQQWLNSIDLTNYCSIFEQHKINGKILLKLINKENKNKDKGTKTKENIDDLIENILLKTSSLKDYFIFIDELNKLNINKEDIFSEDDILCLPPNTDLNTLIAISYSLSQAARLEVLKIAVNYYQKNLMVLTEKLAKNGKIGLRKNHWSKLVHHCEMLRDLLFDFGAQPILTQVPNYIEQRSNDCEAIYNAVLDYLDFDDDLNEISQQIEQLKNRYQSDWEACRDNYGFRLEMIIILFFVIDTIEFWETLFYKFKNLFVTELQSY